MTKTYDVFEFKGPYAIYSNFAYTPMVVPSLGNRKFYYLENAYQAGKSEDPAVWEEFTDPLMTPGQAKRKGQLLKLRPDWEGIVRLDSEPLTPFKIAWMYELLQIKFRPTLWRRKLQGSMSGEIVEGNDWHDLWWGVCNGKCKYGPHEPTGENHLGKLLMKLRHSYIE